MGLYIYTVRCYSTVGLYVCASNDIDFTYIHVHEYGIYVTELVHIDPGFVGNFKDTLFLIKLINWPRGYIYKRKIRGISAVFALCSRNYTIKLVCIFLRGPLNTIWMDSLYALIKYLISFEALSIHIKTTDQARLLLFVVKHESPVLLFMCR